VGYGQTVFIGTPNATAISQVTWIRTGSTTHTFDESARFLRLNFTRTNGGLNVAMPANGSIAPPGYYMLFLLNGSGVPSVAKIIQIRQGGGTTGTLKGTVTNTAGAPLATVRVTTGGVSANSAPDGTYILASVNAGTATVTASLSGYQSSSQHVTVSSGTTTNLPVIRLAPVNPGGITGTVVNSGGTGISGATITAAGLTAKTSSSGAYALHNVPAGTVSLMASVAGYQPASKNVTVTAGNNTAAAAMTLISNVGNVTGKVTDSSNHPISGASVGFGGGTATTNATGTYNFSNIPVGTIQLVASASGFQSVTQSVTVTGGKTTTANFSLTPSQALPGTVTGKVTNISTGGVIAGATVKWNTASVSTNSTGSYVLNNVNSGTQTITASATGYLSRSFTVNVTAGSTSTLNFPLATAGIIKVVALNSTGAADAGATVTIQGGVIPTTVTGTTNSSGTYSSNWIPVGSYTVKISQTGHTTQSKSPTVTAGVTTTVNFIF
jgi:hypothetical protein